MRALLLYLRALGRLFHRLRRHGDLLIIGLLACTNTAVAQQPRAINDQPKQILLQQLHAWLSTQTASSGAVTGINDRRFKVPFCSERFSFNFSDNSNRTIAAECSASRWKRLIRLKSDKPLADSTKNIVYVYELSASVAAEKQIPQHQLVRKQKSSRYVPQNALDQLPKVAFFAARNLRAGQTLTAADIYEAKYVAVAEQAIPAGHAVSKNIFSLQRVTHKVPKDAVTNLSGFDHLATNRLIHAGAILRKRDLKKAKLVRRGEQVVLLAGSHRYFIETTATALEDGYFGDQVKLKNIESNQVVRAIVSGADRAEALR